MNNTPAGSGDYKFIQDNQLQLIMKGFNILDETDIDQLFRMNAMDAWQVQDSEEYMTMFGCTRLVNAKMVYYSFVIKAKSLDSKYIPVNVYISVGISKGWRNTIVTSDLTYDRDHFYNTGFGKLFPKLELEGELNDE